MDNMSILIEKIQNCIFDFDIKNSYDNIVKLVEKLISKSKSLNDQNLSELNEILYYMNLALDNKDYMLYSDILEYELKKFIAINI